MYFYVFISRFCGWVGVFFSVGWFLVYLVWVGAWVLCWCLASWLMIYDVWWGPSWVWRMGRAGVSAVFARGGV
jgi:hypothetical protein